MRSIVLGVCVLAAACSGQALNSPTSPTSVTSSTLSAARTQARAGTALPFHGSFTSASHSSFQPPVTLVIESTGQGEATLLGRFTLAAVDFVNTSNETATGRFDLTAANGDRLLVETVGNQTEFTPPNISRVALDATIVAGDGRFAGATGTFTIVFTQVIDFATDTATASGSFEGQINLNE